MNVGARRVYTELVTIYTRLHRYAHAESILSWDFNVNISPKGTTSRAACLAELRLLVHSILNDPKIETLFQSSSKVPEVFNEAEKANLTEMKRYWRTTIALPPILVERISLACDKCEHAWRSQRQQGDWKGFLVNFKEVVALAREEASLLQQKFGFTTPYDALLDKYDPEMTMAKLNKVFQELKTWIPDLIREVVILQKKRGLACRLTHPIPIENQKKLGLFAMKCLKFDFEAGRLDISKHPFCGGVSDDVRITTRYSEDPDLAFQSLMGVMHETGHAKYEQNLPSEWKTQPVGRARSMAIHESQSLFMEMHIGRSRPFLRFLQPSIIQHFGSHGATVSPSPALELDNLHRLITEVKPGPIRVNADELTYPMHVILRYEIESALINGEIEPEDIPLMWNQKMKAYLEIDTTGNFTNGCMQDIHWPMGAFGYFPSYTLGAMYAAQFGETLRRIQKSTFDARIAAGDLDFVFEFLKKAVWQKGSLFNTEQILREATGEGLNASFYREHLERRYLTR